MTGGAKPVVRDGRAHLWRYFPEDHTYRCGACMRRETHAADCPGPLGHRWAWFTAPGGSQAATDGARWACRDCGAEPGEAETCDQRLRRADAMRAHARAANDVWSKDVAAHLLRTAEATAVRMVEQAGAATAAIETQAQEDGKAAPGGERAVALGWPRRRK